MTVTEEMRLLIDALPEDVANDALDYLRWLAQDSDTLTSEELAGVRLGEEEIANGEIVTRRTAKMLAR